MNRTHTTPARRRAPLIRTYRPTLVILTLLLACSATAAPGKWKHRENPDVLWHFVHDKCAPAAARGIYPPAPCVEVDHPHDITRGYVVFKDRDGRHQYLVLPLARITGIESPVLRSPDAPNYLGDAWTARMYVEAALHRPVPRDALSLVVNARTGRSQNQLHIHVDCVAPAVHATLQRLLPGITDRWRPLPARLKGRHYIARWLAGANIASNPFRLLAKALKPDQDIGLHSLVLVGAHDTLGRPGFILLSTAADPATGNKGNSDALQDRTCAVLEPPAD